MSLFGQPAAGQGGSSSPFSGLNLNTGTTDAQGKRKSIFDASTSQQTSQPFSFPGLNTNPTTTSSGSTGGLFSLGGGAAKPSGPTFSFGTATTTSAPSTGLFGSTTATSAPSTGLFGTANSATQQPAPTTSLFGASATAQQPANSSTFGNTFSANTAAPSGPQQPDAPPFQVRDAAYFSSLLERQKKKPKLKTEDNGRVAQLSGLSMDLGDLARRAQEIRQRGPKQAESFTDSRAHYLLAGSGVSPGQAYKDFQALGPDEAPPMSRNIAQSFADESSVYLRDLRVKGRDAMLRESIDRVYREVDKFIEESLGVDFEEQKMRIMEHFGLAPPEDSGNASGSKAGGFGRSTQRDKGKPSETSRATRSIFGRSAIDKSIIGTPGSGAGTTSFFKSEGPAAATPGLSRGQSLRDLREKERAFIEKVQQLNTARLQDESYPLLQNFAEAENEHGRDGPRQLVDAYHALRKITREGKSSIRERQYAEAYLDENDDAKHLKLKKQTLEGSRSYLEEAFWRESRSLVEKNPREGALGGQPSVLNIVRAYIRIRAARRDLVPDGAELQQVGGENGDYCWVLIFYLLRCGFVNEAAEYVKNDPAFQSMDRRIISYVTAYADSPDRRLPKGVQNMIDNEYQKLTKLAPKNTVDPYKIACYKVIGRCDLTARNLDAVGQGVEDWLWLQFTLARETGRSEELAGDIFGLDQIRETVTEIGQKHFQKTQVEGSSAYGTFLLMQVLAGMFEQAVDYLHNFNPTSAVHLAIALTYYGLLRVSDFSVAGNELLTYSTTQLPQLNFVPLIAYYTATFRTALPVAAVDYVSMICLNSDLQPTSLGLVHTNACHECLRELCLETREFAKLLGDIRSDGTRIPGAIEVRAKLIHLETRDEFLRSITSQSAAIADQRGQISDAVLLYHLCEDFDNVVSVLNRALADAVSLDLGESPMQLQPLKPRRPDGQTESSGSTQGNGPQSSLSLTQSTSSPIELARNMISLYNENALYYNKISGTNREVCGVLLRLLSVRAHLEAQPPRFMTALEELNDLNILPLRANGHIPTIRAAADAFAVLPQVLARCAGVSVVWAVRAIGGERDNIMRDGRWEAGYGGDADGMKDQLSDMAKDLMVFAGLVKYKLPGRVYDMLTRVGGDVGAF
ncbi:nuclear pore complex subunit [Exophiala xenobiotica]|nr:nuclear pore complex subunit [Exophiala xenobiotica]KAK5206924.1 nuclear pore complex subunit [Exophiala xenobiotica]KAK5232490.1 nuclear pore complex subunit [Exophiala xenobiotica]KAK5251605.1 nuclear pore complex subunit [Exophiala xenobiotica]KAK5283766.1 nuclear pore complex subunit [Exophiala xenobiotica]